MTGNYRPPAVICSNATSYMLEKRQGSRKPALYITDADFADDLTLISNFMELVPYSWKSRKLMLTRLEIAKETVGLHINCKKTKL